ncbi:hypothetical protein H8E88_20500 [candidate division KSB1 bacterium]|nr:hypothetical protein [candidate division KSB1 bacterium]MBL7093357.1 hypothetical protein [candidate division KSB1 bacterium]
MNKKHFSICLKILLPITCLMLLFCQRRYNHNYWTETGFVIQNIKWEIGIADSSYVLKEQNGIWLLPVLPDSVTPDTTITRHLQPEKPVFSKLLGRVNQEVIHKSGVIRREFYCFTKRGVELLGYESSDTTQLLTIYEPRLLVLPAELDQTDSTFISQAIPKTWNAVADSFRTGQKTKMQIKKIKQIFCIDIISVRPNFI